MGLGEFGAIKEFGDYACSALRYTLGNSEEFSQLIRVTEKVSGRAARRIPGFGLHQAHAISAAWSWAEQSSLEPNGGL